MSILKHSEYSVSLHYNCVTFFKIICSLCSLCAWGENEPCSKTGTCQLILITLSMIYSTLAPTPRCWCGEIMERVWPQGAYPVGKILGCLPQAVCVGWQSTSLECITNSDKIKLNYTLLVCTQDVADEVSNLLAVPTSILPFSDLLITKPTFCVALPHFWTGHVNLEFAPIAKAGIICSSL